jgi:hypothetical protein
VRRFFYLIFAGTDCMSKDSSDDLPKREHSFTRRRFVQSTALLSSVSIAGKQFFDPSPAHAQKSTAVVKLAQAAPMQGARPPATASQKLPELPVTPELGLQEFISLSRVLTGIDHIEPDLAAEYLQRCTTNPAVSGQLKRLVQALSMLQGSRGAIEKGLVDALHADTGLFAAAEQIIYLWYIGAFYKFPDASGGAGFWEYGPPEHYFRGKVWGVIGVTPPMTSGGPPGFWSRNPARNGA